MQLFKKLDLSAVYSEVVTKGLLIGAPDAESVDYLVRQGHIVVVDVTLPSPLPKWAQTIDLGEAQVVSLALDQRADWALIDNAHARKAARGLGLPLKGTIGLLLEALKLRNLSRRNSNLSSIPLRLLPAYGSVTPCAIRH